MIRLLTIIGARPQIIKAAAISRAIKNHFSDKIEEKILHTGQHYDDNMSKVFFDELGIPAPDYNLGVGSGKHGEQSAKIIVGVEEVLLSEHFDGVIVYGDTNSTLAAAVAASKLHIPLFHIEAGLRSFNMTMPEEINRIVCDQLSSILFAPTETAIDNLRKEGFMTSPAKFAGGKGRLVVNSGDVMYDNSMYFAAIAEEKSSILKENNLISGKYILTTIHRPVNTDSPERLTSILEALISIAETHNEDLVFPLHPRTRNLLEKNLKADVYQKLMTSPRVKILPPASFFDIIVLEKNAHIVMTDSGGVQKESFFFERPCVILRGETEWVEIVTHGAGIIADADGDTIKEAYNKLSGQSVSFPRLFGDGNAATKILDTILEYLA